MPKKKNKILLIAILLFTFLILIFAFIIEYLFDHEPCKLCIYQRIPYFLSILLIIQILLFGKYEKITLLLLSFLFIGSFLLAFYHFGIEQGFFDESIAFSISLCCSAVEADGSCFTRRSTLAFCNASSALSSASFL